jgi:hypothetical protein
MGETVAAKRAEMVRHEVLRTLTDPREIANAELAAVPEHSREHEPRRIRERACALGGRPRRSRAQAPAAKLLGAGEVEAQEFAAIVPDANILTLVALLLDLATERATRVIASQPGSRVVRSWRVMP